MLLHVMKIVYTAADAIITALVGIDISAAFDTIDHDMLASRLESQFGVVGAASSWLQSYLCGCQLFVRLGGHSSPMTQCDCGVPQVSVLGPLLFTAYVSAVGELIDSSRTACHKPTTSSPTTHISSSAWTAPTPRRPSTGSPTARPQFASGSCRTASNSTLTSQRVSLPRLSTSLLSCRHHQVMSATDRS